MRKIFGIGLSKTGTTSLTAALADLGLRSRHFPADEVTRREVANYLDHPGDRIDLPLLKEYHAITDTPVCCVYPALDRSYPHSRFILTVRSSTGWIESCRRHWVFHPVAADGGGMPPNGAYVRRIRHSLCGTTEFNAAVGCRARNFTQRRHCFRNRPESISKMLESSGSRREAFDLQVHSIRRATSA